MVLFQNMCESGKDEQIHRNIDKFPEDFMFQLTQEEFANLKS